MLHAIVTDEKELEKKYRFLVNARSQYQAKSPYEMFPTDTIENDMAKVFEYIDAFNTANPAKEPSIPISQYAYNETRYKMLTQMNEERAEELMKEAQHDAKARWTLYQQMASMHYGNDEKKS